jgi:methylmalonyl-CoA mutase
VLRSGSFKREIDATWEQRKKDLARRKTPITGVSEFPNLKEAPVERAAVDTSRIEREIGQTREQRAVDTNILEQTAKVSDAKGKARFNAATAACLAGASRSQIENALGRHPEKVEAFHLRRFAAGFEKLRDASDAVLKTFGKRPRIFLANMGPIAVHTARAMFSQNFFEAGGFEGVTNDGFATAQEAAKACKDAGCTLAILCSSDSWYETGATDVAAALKQAGVQTLFLAGHPGAREEEYRKAGIDNFIFVGCDVEATLTDLARAQGVLS